MANRDSPEKRRQYPGGAGGAPKGNKNHTHARMWRTAIIKAVENSSSNGELMQGLIELAHKLVENCQEGDLQALIELGNRIDGRIPNQAPELDANGDPTVGPRYAKIEFVSVSAPTDDDGSEDRTLN